MTIFRAPVFTLGMAAAAMALISASAAEAGFRRLRSDYAPGEVIVANSRYGNGSVTGVVRPGRNSWEVRLPHGTWVGCRRSCEETLRVQTVDLFENSGSFKGYGDMSNECGVFGCLSLGF